MTALEKSPVVLYFQPYLQSTTAPSLPLLDKIYYENFKDQTAKQQYQLYRLVTSSSIIWHWQSKSSVQAAAASSRVASGKGAQKWSGV